MHTGRISLSKPQRMFRDTAYEDARLYVCSVVLMLFKNKSMKASKKTQAQKCCKENLLFPPRLKQEIKARWGDKGAHMQSSATYVFFMHSRDWNMTPSPQERLQLLHSLHFPHDFFIVTLSALYFMSSEMNRWVS